MTDEELTPPEPLHLDQVYRENALERVTVQLESVLANQGRLFARFDVMSEQISTFATKPAPDDPRGVKQMVQIALTLAMASIGFTITVLVLLVQHIITSR